MASDTVHTAEILVKDLPTKSVAFTPERATVVREVQDVVIKPGPNEITIYGLDADTDLDSIRVTGRGPATITDIQTEIVPQREQFEDVFPNDSDDEDSDAEDPENDYGVDRSELKAIQKEIKALKNQKAKVRNEQATAATSLEFLDHYGKSMYAKDVDVSKMENYLKLYQEQRIKLGETHQECTIKIAEMDEEESKLVRTQERLRDTWTKAKNAAAKEDRKRREKKQREKDMKQKQKQRLRMEQEKFWPKFSVSQVVLHLDGFPGLTPNSSRRSSIVSGKKPELAHPNGSDSHTETVSFSLTYVTAKATWSPRYELSLKTPSSSGKVVYLAQYQNFSSETWRDANVTLTTSQTSFSGLSEKIPWLQAWQVKLRKGQETAVGKKDANWSGGLENKIEISARMQQQMPTQKRHPHNNAFGNQWGQAGFQQPMQQQQRNAPVPPPVPVQQAALNNAAAPAGFGQSMPAHYSLFGSSSQASGPSLVVGGTHGRAEASIHDGAPDVPSESNGTERDIDDETLGSADNVLAFQESSRQDYGLTTTYDVPGYRTVRPSSLKRRHVIAELDLTSVTLSHIIIPKLRPAAFLKAKIKNTSPVTLLRGQAGLTLDGTFLGTTAIPSCSPDSIISLPLGVDPSIHVTYAKPTVRRATSGFFNKEDCAVFTRNCWINNTKSTPVNVLVLEQVPVSEDERLRINILEPKGLEKEGDKVKAGQAVEPGKANWGKGFAIMGKGGEVKWEITIEKGKQAKLVLEYEARIPSGQKIVGLD